MQDRILKKGGLLLLALIFTVGLTFASVELPYRVDELLQNTLQTPGADSHADEVSRIKTELFMAHYHVRTLGYIGFFLLLALIGVGFSTRRTGLAALGAVGVMLPCFAQFAGVMFFLAGLGILNALWLPVLDISYGLQDLGLVINAPDHLLRWLLGLAGVHSLWPRAILFLAVGILVFILGVYAWLANRARGEGVADFLIYRISRHPQYLGWIIWTYGAYVLIQRMHYPKRSWGIGASLPWLLSTMVIIGVAMMEELNMRKRHGEAYQAYRKRAPFLFPVPRVVERAFSAPFRLLFRKDQPERPREVVTVVAFYTALLMGASALFYAGGWTEIAQGFASPATRRARVADLARQVREEPTARFRGRLADRLGASGEMALAPLVEMLEDEDPGMRILAAEVLGRYPDQRAVPVLTTALSDPVEDVRLRALDALTVTAPEQALPHLLTNLHAPEAHLHLPAFRALSRLKVSDVLERAPALLSDSASWNRVAAVDALGELGSEEALPLLAERLKDDSDWVRRQTVIALLRIGSARARPTLEAALRDQDFEVRLYAEEALKRLPPG